MCGIGLPEFAIAAVKTSPLVTAILSGTTGDGGPNTQAVPFKFRGTNHPTGDTPNG